MLNDHDRRTLAEIERHLQEDADLHRAFGRRPRAVSGVRRVWFVLLLVSLMLMVGTAALHASGAAFECGALAVVIGTGLRSTSTSVQHGAGRGSVPDRRR